ncbi:CPBP family intramembrane metalloprotease domain-containing protein [Brachybacterium endophyticum]|uniref:CPBP family intramembrane metalloprotease domain-containing protein n=1 Tax=Brachybacterium endophyticum TaxID=2182385 RepID=A0A2U2RHU9_9MICO|nr:CPBP family intramembrane glutamic endopeptidase [Brachybacterium endophyticum]PWH05449.1 CPBP family intramembrane metalloprotease domain-containing protein [Brachybacterium endophyticum]
MSTSHADPAPTSDRPDPLEPPAAHLSERENSRPRAAVVPPVVHDQVPWKRVGLFILISYAILALFALPFWFLSDGISSPLFTPVIAVGMWAPAIASLILAKGVERTSWRTRVGLRFRGRWRSIVVWSLIAVVAVVVVHALSAVIMVLRGVPGDLTGRTWIEMGTRQVSDMAGTDVPAIAFVLVALVSSLLGLVITFVAALGEEIGWRGWLWPALRPLGRVRAMLVMGAIWGLWHLPIMLIGYNYGGVARYIAIPMFILPCIALSLLFCALTDRAGGNPIPAAWAHSAVNSLGATVLGFVSTAGTGAAIDPLIDTVLGVVGIALVALAGIVIAPWRTRAPIVHGLTTPAHSDRLSA